MAKEPDAQKELRDYHAGRFQTHDPVTGEPRGPAGPFANIDKLDTFSKAGAADDTAPAGGDDYDSWTVEELRDEAADLDVRRGDGADGQPLKADLIKALRKRDRGG